MDIGYSFTGWKNRCGLLDHWCTSLRAWAKCRKCQNMLLRACTAVVYSNTANRCAHRDNTAPMRSMCHSRRMLLLFGQLPLSHTYWLTCCLGCHTASCSWWSVLSWPGALETLTGYVLCNKTETTNQTGNERTCEKMTHMSHGNMQDPCTLSSWFNNDNVTKSSWKGFRY